MKFISVLRKLGILRFGIKKYSYTSGRKMPAEALLDDVYDAENDLVTIRELKQIVSRKPSRRTQIRHCSRCM